MDAHVTAGTSADFFVLGPVGIVHGGVPVRVTEGRLQVVLSILLLEAGKVVSVQRLVDALWADEPPVTARGQVQICVSALRRLLAGRGALILTQSPGYLLQIPDGSLDLWRFRDLCAKAESLAGQRPEEAVTCYREALLLWRGEACASVDSRVVKQAAIRLNEERWAVQERCMDLELRLGRHQKVAGELAEIVAAQPLKERPRALLMLALYRSGRQAEALDCYRDARRLLVKDLGVEPGSELRLLHERILAGSPDLLAITGEPVDLHSPNGVADPGRAGAAAPSTVSEVPRQLPGAIAHFVGRTGELATLDRLLDNMRRAAPGTVVISTVTGTAGVGKTALAVHWAHLHADRFPGGQLYVNLRGFDPSSTPMAPDNAVRRFLRALGVPAERIPVDVDEQAALYRSEVANRRMLVVLDNARDVEQVRPLLPGSLGCLVLITSRNRLDSLVALDGAVSLTLDLLTESEACDLLDRRLGHERIAAEQQTVGELIEACVRLPLALNIVAAHAALNPRRPLSDLANELRDTRQRLGALTTGHNAADVRAVFSCSYQTLTPESARLFRLLGMHVGPDISLEAAASLCALELGRTRRGLTELEISHLITQHAPGRYSFHDLLRAYATDLASACDSEPERGRALRRVWDFYAHTGHTADRLMDPHRFSVSLRPPAPGTQLRPLTDEVAGLAWLDAEYPNLLAAQQAAAAHHQHQTVWQLAWALNNFHLRRGHLGEDLAVWQAALNAAEYMSDSDPIARAHAYGRLGRAYARLGRYRQAVEYVQQALALAEQHDGLIEQAHAHRQIAWIWERQGDHQRALEHVTLALDICHALGDTVWEADALNAAGWYAACLGDFDTARVHCKEALLLHQDHHYPEGEAAVLDSLGYIEYSTGHHQQAIGHYQHAIEVCHRIGESYYLADTLDRLGHPYAALGRGEHALAIWRQALDFYQRQGRVQDADRVQQQLDALNQPNVGELRLKADAGPRDAHS